MSIFVKNYDLFILLIVRA